MKWLLRYSTLLALLGSVAWLTHAPDWEPAIAVVTSLVAFIGFDVAVQRRTAQDEQRVAADRELFARFRAMLPHEPTMRFFRGHDYGGEFEFTRHTPLHEFADFCTTPECRFLTSGLEDERARLQNAVQAFRAACLNRIFPSDHSGWCGVPKDWLHTGPGSPSFERFQEAEETLNTLANQMCAAYDRFIQKGRAVLHVP